MDRADIAVTLPWMGAGTEFVCRVVDALPDDVLRGPSALPGWSRAHVVGHLARNAEALSRLAHWARTGEETPMYASREARAADIEASAAYPIDQLRAELISTADELDATFAGLDLLAWRATVRNAQGRDIAATELPWMRVREVWMHAGASLFAKPISTQKLLPSPSSLSRPISPPISSTSWRLMVRPRPVPP